MFKLIDSNPKYRFILLRCQSCNQSSVFDKDDFFKIKPDSVVLKENVKITCPTCGNSQPMNKRLITLEPQTVSYQFTAPITKPSKGLFHRIIDSMANMTQDEILSVSNQIAAFNTDFPDLSD